jgi:dTMP kinase
MFVTLEGGEGSGKSTIIRMLQDFFNNEGIDFIVTREPGGTDIGKQIREVIVNKENTMMDSETEALLYAADRNQHLKETILPALNAGRMVICDRYVDSNFVYQGYARGLGIEKILKANEAINYKIPDLTLYFDLDPEIGLNRINKDKNREVNRLDLESLDFHKKVRNGYLELAKQFDRIVIIDANRSPEEIFNDVKKIIISKIKELN